MLKIYIGQTIPNVPLVELVRPNLGAAKLDRWTERYVELGEKVVDVVDTPSAADYLLVPHNYNFLRSNPGYLKSFEDLSLTVGKKILIFFPGDSSDKIPLRNCIVFRNSQYKTKLSRNELITPGYVEDLGKSCDIKPRTKSGMMLVIGFCGWAGFKNLKDHLKFIIKTLPISIASIAESDKALNQKGLWWRRKILNRLGKSKLIKTNFIIRKSYSGNEKTIELDPNQARKEYIQNILNSDFTLCVKGDGNFSTRFFEVLSLGRIPLLIDTDSILPLEDVIDYSKIVLRVSWREIHNIDNIVADFFSQISPEEFIAMQIKAREIFERYLRLDSYFKFIFQGDYLERSPGTN